MHAPGRPGQRRRDIRCIRLEVWYAVTKLDGDSVAGQVDGRIRRVEVRVGRSGGPACSECRRTTVRIAAEERVVKVREVQPHVACLQPDERIGAFPGNRIVVELQVEVPGHAGRLRSVDQFQLERTAPGFIRRGALVRDHAGVQRGVIIVVAEVAPVHTHRQDVIERWLIRLGRLSSQVQRRVSDVAKEACRTDREAVGLRSAGANISMEWRDHRAGQIAP